MQPIDDSNTTSGPRSGGLESFIDTTEAMLQELEQAPEFLPSVFWRDLNKKNVEMLEVEGLANFKRTLSQNYYNWMITSAAHPMFRHAFLSWLRRPSLLPFASKLENIEGLRYTTSDQRISLSPIQRFVYKLYVGFVWDLMRRKDSHGVFAGLAEPQLGNPIQIRHRGTLLSQDLANSVLECNAIADLVGSAPNARVAELGAGYGRLAHAFAATQSGKYFIFDIPPALAVAQWYLEQVLGPERIFRFRHFDRIEDVATEMDRASVVFLTANQMRKFPDGYFDVLLSISTLPELTQEQVDLYLGLFQRLSGRYIFLKQWKRWRNPLDGTDLTMDSYKLRPDWRLKQDRTDPINPMFFNRVWERRDGAAGAGADGPA